MVPTSTSRSHLLNDTGDCKIGSNFLLDIVHVKVISRQINRLPISLLSKEVRREVSARRVAPKLARIRTMVKIRRSQRREVCNEIWAVMDIGVPLMPATFDLFACHGSKLSRLVFVIDMTPKSDIGTHL